jgi:hypothetical protein
MELQNARAIIDSLARGIHPDTGEVMPPESPYNAPGVIRALFTVSQALEHGAVATPPKVATRAAAPLNAGKPWSAEDDAQLEAGFDRGEDLRALADALGRTRFGIEQRLIKLGKIAPHQGGGRFGATAARAEAPGVTG